MSYHNAFCIKEEIIMNLKQKTDNILNMYGLKAKKRFGQNFLVDENIIERIVDESNISKDDVVIEIGPGLGNLTEILLEKSGLVVAFEIDEDMIRVLNGRFKNASNFILINKDILQVNIKEVLEDNNVKVENIKLVANLPYYITTPIMFKIFEEANYIESMTVMVQKEVADRIVAKPRSKDYGVLTINTKYYGQAEKLFDVPNTSFVPAPNVTSSIVKIDICSRYEVKNTDMFFKTIKAAFAQRRKKLLNSIENSHLFNIGKENFKEILKQCDISENVRAEEIDIETYIMLSDKINNETNKEKSEG